LVCNIQRVLIFITVVNKAIFGLQRVLVGGQGSSSWCYTTESKENLQTRISHYMRTFDMLEP